MTDEDNLDESNSKQKNIEGNYNKRNIPIKDQIRTMEDDIKNLKEKLADNRKLGMGLRGDLGNLETTITQKCHELEKCISDDLKNFEKDLKRVEQNDKQELAFFDLQVKSLNEDKVKLAKETYSLNDRLTNCEKEIGIDSKMQNI